MNKLNILSAYFIMVLALAAPFATYAMEPDEDHEQVHAPRHFVRPAYLRAALDLDQPILEAIYHLTPPLRQFERFLNGKLIYEENDEGRIELRIADLLNPLEGEFDLSNCGDAGECLSINTGYRKGIRPNAKKVEIWFAPHSLIERNLAGSASHFNGIMGSWDPCTAPVGTFLTGGDWDDLVKYYYTTKMNWGDYNNVENDLDSIKFSNTPNLLTRNVTIPYADYFHIIFD